MGNQTDAEATENARPKMTDKIAKNNGDWKMTD